MAHLGVSGSSCHQEVENFLCAGFYSLAKDVGWPGIVQYVQPYPNNAPPVNILRDVRSQDCLAPSAFLAFSQSQDSC